MLSEQERLCYRSLKEGEIIQHGDLELGGGEHDHWTPVLHRIGSPAPAPEYPAHSKFLRRILCAWKADDDGVLHAACGQAYCFEHEFTVGGAYQFCPGCGKPIRLCPPTLIPESES